MQPHDHHRTSPHYSHAHQQPTHMSMPPPYHPTHATYDEGSYPLDNDYYDDGDETGLASLLPHLSLSGMAPSGMNMPLGSNICLTDSEISARTLAASGLNVSAPEFIPSFASPGTPLPSALQSSTSLDNGGMGGSASASVSASGSAPGIPSEHPLSPPDTYAPPPELPKPDVYSNVTHLLPEVAFPPPRSPATVTGSTVGTAFASPTRFRATSDSSSPRNDVAVPTTAQAVHHFDAHFPSLHTANAQRGANLAASSTAAGVVGVGAGGGSAAAAAAVAAAAASTDVVDAALAPKALAWRQLQEAEAEKARAADMQRRLDALQGTLASHGHYDGTAYGGGAHVEGDDGFGYTGMEHHGYDGGYDATDMLSPGFGNVTDDVGPVWVMTGQSVGMLYEALRAEAAQQASVRNKYFDRAATSFKKGDGAGAKKWSALGKEANERMKELHRKAANAIFEARNPPGVDDVIDLHGLHVSEAVERLPAALERGVATRIRILTGTGHHTKGTGRARLRPAVKKWLQDNGYFFEEVVDANEYVGSFIVDVKR